MSTQRTPRSTPPQDGSNDGEAIELPSTSQTLSNPVTTSSDQQMITSQTWRWTSFLDNPAILANPAIRKRFFQTVRLLVLLLGWLAIWYLGKEYGMSSMTQYFFFIGWMYTCLDPGFDHTKRFGAATYQFAQAGFQGLSGANTQSDS